jgi:hypothetical protein
VPVLKPEELQQAAIDGSIGGVCIDTSVFEQYQFGFEVGVLATLSQFNKLNVSHLVPDLIEHEVRSHLIEAAAKDRRAVKNSLKPLTNSWGVSVERRDKLVQELFENKTESDRANERLENFFADSAAENIKTADWAKLGDVVSRFTDGRAPFGAKEAKKHEFPDALVLTALEGWAEKNAKYVLVVSNDGDWSKFAAESDTVICIKELPAALTLFNPDGDKALALFRAAAEAGQIPDLIGTVMGGINSQTDKIDVQIEADSSFLYEEELDEVSVLPPENGIVDLLGSMEVVEYEDKALIVQVTLTCAVDAKFVVDYQVWDGVDKEYMPMGTGTLFGREDADLDVLLTIIFDEGQIILDGIELLESRLVMEFSDIRPDWMLVEEADRWPNDE